MPEVRDVYTAAESMDIPELHARREEIIESCGGDYRALSQENVAELLAITRGLRKRSGPVTKKSAAAPPADNSDLL